MPRRSRPSIAAETPTAKASRSAVGVLCLDDEEEMSDLTICEEYPTTEQFSSAPLYLQHYLDEQHKRQSHGPVTQPPGSLQARGIERRGNVIVLEFADGPRADVSPRRRVVFGCFWLSGRDVGIVLLILGTAAACAALFLH